MPHWKHELSRQQYELVIDSIIRASTIASLIEETAGRIESAALRDLAAAIQEHVLQCLVIGHFDEADVAEIQKEVHARMYTRSDA